MADGEITREEGQRLATMYRTVLSPPSRVYVGKPLHQPEQKRLL